MPTDKTKKAKGKESTKKAKSKESLSESEVSTDEGLSSVFKFIVESALSKNESEYFDVAKKMMKQICRFINDLRDERALENKKIKDSREGSSTAKPRSAGDTRKMTPAAREKIQDSYRT